MVRKTPIKPTTAIVPRADAVSINCEYELLAFI